jgi:uncharacterized membrane protein YfcA
MILLIGIALGILVGGILGLTGAGGSVLAVPMLMAGFGWRFAEAAPVALIAVAASAMLGTWLAWRRSYVRYRAATLMGMSGWVTAPLGLHAARHLPEVWLLSLFAGVMVIVALRMLRQSLQRPAEARIVRATVAGEGPPAQGHLVRLNSETGRLVWTPRTAAIIGSIGVGTGFLSGLLGVGGGFVIVPALRATTPLSMHSAVATSLMTIAIVASGTVAAAALQPPGLAWMQALPFAAGSLLGMGLGRAMAPSIAGAHLEQSFAVMMLLVAAGLGVHAASLH